MKRVDLTMKSGRVAALMAVCCMFSTLAPAIALSQDGETSNVWGQWRGPNRDSKIAGNDWPSTLGDSSLQQTWRIELGPSYSGPIVSDDRVFVTETKDEKFEVVHAIDRKTGSVIWSQQWEGSIEVPFFAKENGDWIRSTPAFDGERLYVAGIREFLVCLDAGSGDILWKLDLAQSFESGVPSFGCACSPMIVDDHLYIQAGGALTKLNKRSGEVIWQALPNKGSMMSDGAFSSPIYTTINDVPQLLVQTRTTLAGVTAEDGKVLWQVDVPAFRGMNILTPTVIDNKVFTSTYGGKSYMFDVIRDGNNWKCESAWETNQQGYMSSPVIIGDYVYNHLKNRRFTCVNAKTGEIAWTTQPYGKYWSMVAQGNKILALDQRGDLLLIQADPSEFKLLDSRSIASDAWAHLAVSGDGVFVRELNAIAGYVWKK